VSKPIPITKATYARLKKRADREGVTVAELIDRLISVALDEEMRWS
jgi:hypothetical protein